MSKIGLISDTHDNLNMVKAAVKKFNEFDLALVIHCGDFIAPFTLENFRGLKAKLLGVFGNCDDEKEGLKRKAEEIGFSLQVPPYKLELEGKKILVSHYPITPPSGIDILIHGHTHKPQVKEGNPLIINPGESSGWFTGKATIGILDLDNLKVEIIELWSYLKDL
ncbi:MAG: metallophosphoesterase [candidate division WOR-3 bacterium]|nr:metallophosphoesterase [candidate division WOR-3 bacterium]